MIQIYKINHCSLVQNLRFVWKYHVSFSHAHLVISALSNKENRVGPSPFGFDFGLWDFGLGLDNKTFKETDLYSCRDGIISDDLNSEQLKLFQCLGFVMLICKPELAQTFIRNPI